MQNTKLWKGRFSKAANSSAEVFGASIFFDERLYKQDIQGSIAHAKMLAKQGILTKEEGRKIEAALLDILQEIEAGKIHFSVEQEDIHMNIESILTSRIGDLGKKLHTARSRNDQVALDFRMYVKEQIGEIIALLDQLIRTLHEIAKKHRDVVMPGYTHLQRAQPVLLSHHLLAYLQMFSRDQERFKDCFKRTDYMPLGCGALAGTTYDTDREFLAQLLAFEHLCENSMDAVSDRDFAIEFLSDCSIAMMHLSRFCEELILWSSKEFDFIEMDDAFSTGSSIMPQKKNPDMAELIRGKTGRVYGDLFALLTLMKGLPLAYNKDMQEDKPPVFDATDTLKASLEIFVPMLTSIRFKQQNMFKAAKGGFMNATDAADYLVSKGLAFRDCHEIIGKMVLFCIDQEKAIEDLNLEELKQFSALFEEDFYEKVSVEACIKNKRSRGSTSFSSVEDQLEQFEKMKGRELSEES